MRLRFLSNNAFKIAEVQRILGPVGIEIVPIDKKIEEIQTTDLDALVRDKCIKAFHLLGHPVFVEHTGLFIEQLNHFPGGLTQIFWDTLGADRVSTLYGKDPDSKVIARTRIGFCDGRRIHQFEGEIRGRIPTEPRGDRAFQWDCVFVPEGSAQTFAEMGDAKDEISMRRKALERFVKHLKAIHHA
jgi:XTP/dITP diphosphohydrolase